MNVTSQNDIVGTLENISTDMWYLEGDLHPRPSLAAAHFVARASSIVPTLAMGDPRAGFRAYLSDDDGPERTLVIVMGFSNGRLFVRRVLAADAQEWVIANVPE